MNRWIELLLGLILVVGVIIFAFYSQNFGSWNFLSPAWAFLKGAIFWGIFGLGTLFILLGISDLKG